ncbi:hypothetical protein B0T09DRAFT_317225 [Sordaria sp. MPI-SDFR-AT-0083]|nr:hypothetical protein B0T09DRAFT_317225 [Sordaria sp. MPI-SDFR-AT-0083]
MANSIISRNLSSSATRYYDQATFYRSLETIYNSSSSSPSTQQYLDHVTTQISTLFTPNGTSISWDHADHQLDNIRIASSILFLYTQTPAQESGATKTKTKYRAALDFLFDQLVNKQKRNPEGGFWHIKTLNTLIRCG